MNKLQFSILNFQFVIRTLGSILILETIFLLMATGVAFLYGGADAMPLLFSAGLMLAVGILFFLIGRKANEKRSGRREGMLTVALTWMALSFFGMAPFYLGGYINSIPDAYMEAMSGFTTTGIIGIVEDVELLPHGIRFWRSLMQWQGGIGMVVFTVALLPVFGGGASQLFDAEVTGFTHERFLPRVTEVAKRLSGVYLLLTFAFTILLWTGPMDFFDAVNHAMTGISTGGLSTKNANIVHWNSPYIEYIMMLCMCIGGMKLPLFYFSLKGNFNHFRQDEETRWYLIYLFVFIAITFGWLFYNGYETGGTIENTFRKAAFQVVSLSTTTGFSTANPLSWGQFYLLIALFLMLICGCGGSTSGGIKMGRALILFKNMYNEFRKQTHPAAVLPVRVNGRAVSHDIIYRVHIFVTIYFLLIGFSWLFLLTNGMSFNGALYVSVSAIGNTGFTPEMLGADSIYDLTVVSKWYISFIMMVGRLEIFTVLTILLPGFWRR